MTATEELRRMLDERGVEYEGGERSVRWRDRNGVMMQAFPLADGELGMDVWSCTPEQAIAATLEDETCFPALSSERDGMPYLNPWWVCSECGCQLTESQLGRIWQNYCPNCGRRIRIRRVDGE